MSVPSPREALLLKAIDYYATHGVRDTSLRTLAAEIGTSQRMLHYHFGSREDLLIAVVETIARNDAALLDRLFDGTGDVLDRGRENWRQIADGAVRMGALFFELSSHVMYGSPHAEPLRQALMSYTEAFTRAYQAVTDPATAASLARLTVAVGRGLTFESLVDGDRAASDAAIDDFIDLVRIRLER